MAKTPEDETVAGGPPDDAPSSPQPAPGGGPGDPEWEARQKVLLGESPEETEEKK